MSQWADADYPKHFYGHEFFIDDDQVKRLQPIRVPNIRKTKYTRFRNKGRFRNKLKRIPKQLNKSTEKSIDQLWDLIRQHDQMLQIRHAHVYAGSNRDPSYKKRTSGYGIEASIKTQERNLNNLKIGHWKYHAYFLIHGNTMGDETFILPKRNITVHGIRPKNGKVLATRPWGDSYIEMRRWVRSYSSKYNYLEQSFKEMQPYVRRNVPWVMMRIHIH